VASPFLIEVAVALLPVVTFLAALLYFDSYRLISAFEVAETITAGLALAIAGYFLNGYLIDRLHVDYALYSHAGGPVVEETLKAVAVVYLFMRNRIGFMIDAAIMGFAVGTGFALFENAYYLQAMQDADFGDWIIRGFGTAIMHGGATALFAMWAESLVEKRSTLSLFAFLPGLVTAILVHALFNELSVVPLLATAIIILGLPPLFLIIFSKSEHAVHQWLVHDYESHQQLLDDIESGRFLHSEAGRFILKLAKKFSQSVIEDIFEYLKLHTICVLRAEAISLARERKEKIEITAEHRADLHRLHLLEIRIGRSAMMALWPHLHFSRRELWELHDVEG
jgi:protease PrsW